MAMIEKSAHQLKTSGWSCSSAIKTFFDLKVAHEKSETRNDITKVKVSLYVTFHGKGIACFLYKNVMINSFKTTTCKNLFPGKKQFG